MSNTELTQTNATNAEISENPSFPQISDCRCENGQLTQTNAEPEECVSASVASIPFRGETHTDATHRHRRSKSNDSIFDDTQAAWLSLRLAKIRRYLTSGRASLALFELDRAMGQTRFTEVQARQLLGRERGKCDG